METTQGLVSVQAQIPVFGNEPIQAAIQAFLGSLDSAHTRRAYASDLKAAFLEMGVSSLDEFAGAHLVAWRERVMQNGKAPNTQRRALASMRSFILWVMDMLGERDGGEAQGRRSLVSERFLKRALKAPKGKVIHAFEVLTPGEIQRVLEACEGQPRAFAMALVLLGGGLRAAEVVALDCVDLMTGPDGGMVLLVHGKGSKERLVPVQDEVADAIRRYLAATDRRMGDPGPLFLAEDRGARKRASLRLDVRRMGKIVDALTKKAALAKEISPHSFRHTFAVQYIRNGGNVVGLQELLGHSSIETTQIYPRHLELAELRRAIPQYTRRERG